MDNISSIVMFTLSGLDESWTNRLIIFVFTLLGFILTVVLNLTLIVIIILQRSLHEPMYIFLCNLCINGLYGSTGFYPVFLYPLTGSNMISLSDCVLQIFVIMTYSLCEFTNLTVMALDRYMAICRPLHYQTVMTRVTIYKLLIFIWLFPCGTTGVSISIMLRYPLCGSHIDRLFCQNWALIERLACQEDIVKHIVNGSFFVWFNSLVAFLIFSYVKIIVACWHSKKNQHKFMSTCLPHLIALVNFIILTIFDGMDSLFGPRDGPKVLGKLMSVAIITISPFINLIIHGVKLTPIRTQIKHVFQQIQS
ncbi:olfactory receptor 5P3-like [Salvelinus namaycush]|uniref:Olfactory receptor 5P3-like n=1 Tax=Salvelinus namaycush TaxID=8040 RepID=A0A8U0QIZ5_SALNM|nr:olfactory receptor 5P3-like [Salvelinus namaycush]